MAFDLVDFYSRHKDYYGDAPLEDVAKDVFQRGYAEKYPDYDTWKKTSGIESVIQEDTRRRNPTFEDKLRGATAGVDPYVNYDRGFIGDVASHLSRGVVQAVKGVGGAMRMADLNPEADEGIISGAGKKITDWATGIEKSSDLLKPDIAEARQTEGFVKRGLMGGIESTPASLVPIVGGIVGGIAGGPVGAAIGAGATLFGTFGLGEYQNTYDETARQLTEKGTPSDQIEDIAHKHALKSSIAEVGGEMVGDIAAFLSFGLLKQAVKQPLKQTIKELVSGGGAKEFVKGLAKQMPFEVGSEMATAYVQTESAREAGLTDMTTKEAMAEAILPAAFMSLMFGGSIRGMQAIEANNLYKKLNSQNIEERKEAALSVAGRMEDKESQKTWLETAGQYINESKEIPLTKPLVDFAAQKSAEEHGDYEILKQQKSIDDIIENGLKTGTYEDKPFTPEVAIGLIQESQKKGIYSPEDLERLKKDHPQLSEPLNVLIVDNIKAEITRISFTGEEADDLINQAWAKKQTKQREEQQPMGGMGVPANIGATFEPNQEAIDREEAKRQWDELHQPLMGEETKTGKPTTPLEVTAETNPELISAVVKKPLKIIPTRNVETDIPLVLGEEAANGTLQTETEVKTKTPIDALAGQAKGNLSRATMSYQSKDGNFVRWQDKENDRLEYELNPPEISSNPGPYWEAGIRHKGWAQEAKKFKTKEDAIQWLDGYDTGKIDKDTWGPGAQFIDELFGKGTYEKVKEKITPDNDAKVKAAITDAKKNGPSNEFRALFGGIDPVKAGTTNEAVAKLAGELGLRWEAPATTAKPRQKLTTRFYTENGNVGSFDITDKAAGQKVATKNLKIYDTFEEADQARKEWIKEDRNRNAEAKKKEDEEDYKKYLWKEQNKKENDTILNEWSDMLHKHYPDDASMRNVMTQAFTQYRKDNAAGSNWWDKSLEEKRAGLKEFENQFVAKNRDSKKTVLIGKYDTTGSTAKDVTERGNLAPDRKFKKDLKVYAKRLQDILGYEPDKDRRGKDVSSYINIAPIGGDGTIILWKPDSEYGIYINVSVEREGDNLKIGGIVNDIMYRATTRKNKHTGMTNRWANGNISAEDLAEKIKQEVDFYDQVKGAKEIIQEARDEGHTETTITKAFAEGEAAGETEGADLTDEQIKSEIADISETLGVEVKLSEEDPFTAAVGVISGGVADRIKNSKYEFVYGDTKAKSDIYYDMVGMFGGGKADRLVDAGITIKAKKTETPAYGASNKIFTEDKAEKARAILKAKLNGTQLNAGIDPEILIAGIDLAGYHIEAGARKFVDFSSKMVADIGDTIKPYLKSLYLAVRNYPGIDNKGMNTEAELDRIITATTKLTYDQFVEQYKEAFKQGNKYKPNEVGFSHYADEMARLADDYPEFLDRFEAEEDKTYYEEQTEKKTPFQYGQEAFAKGLKHVPYHDTKEYWKPGTTRSAEENEQWLKGWEEANLAAPVESPSRKTISILPPKDQKGSGAFNIARLLKAHNLLDEIMKGDDFYRKIKNPPYQDLTIERHGNELYFTHYYEQNGDLIMDGEMVWTVDNDGKLSLKETAVQDPIRGGEHRAKDNTFAKVFARNLIHQGFDKAKLINPREKEQAKAEKETSATSAYGKVADIVFHKLIAKEKFTRNELFAMCSEAFGGTLAEGKFSAKDAYDAMEMGINKYIYNGMFAIPQGQKGAKNVVESLKNLFDLIPTQTTRTAEMDEFQQFSTPPALAFAANWVANLNENDIFMEPSAGTGNIAIFAKLDGVEETIVNELAPRRAAILKEMGFDQVFTENAEQINNILPKEIKPTVVVMNPPFSATAGRIKGERKTSNATVHIEQALKRLVPGGRLVAIVGEGMAADRPTFKPWFNKLAKEYIVRANIGISGQEYVKYGTSFGNQLLVIDKPLSPKSIDNTDKGSIIELTGRVDKIEQLIDLLEGVRNERINLGEQRPAEQGEQEGPGGSQTGTGRDESLQPSIGEMVPRTPAGRSGRQTDRNDSGNDARVGTVQNDEVPDDRPQQRGKSGTRALGEGKEQSGGTGRSDSSGDQRSTDVAPSGRIPEESATENLTVEQKADIEKRVDEPISDAIFDAYKPAKLKIPNSQPHPARLVESSAMASIDPIDPTYSPKIPEKAVKNGNISIAQLEPVVYAGQAHQEILPNGNRKGYFIGDGTGVGKGRIISAILWDNWNKGRTKAVWLSQNSPLIKDAERDISGIGWDKKLLFDIGKVKFHDTIKPTQGIGFMGYGTLSRKTVVNGVTTSRLDQLVNWLGADFDGVIAFDEAHNMGNAFPIRGARGTSQPSQAALAGIELQRRLPNARIIYVSATGATEVMNLAYAERLGLWGDKTAFPTALNFIQDISAGGITSMEMVAMNMKANGVYLARSLACDDVKYERLEHPLTTEQRKIYDELAQAWQITMRNIEAALTATGVTDDEGHTKNKHAKSHILSAYWGTNQRFWNQIITSMQMPTVIKTMEADIKKGNAVVVQLVNTNEAAQGRALARMEEEDNLEDLDITPREMLIEYVNNSFPIHQFEDYMDEDGNVASRPVVDSAGNPVINQEAVDLRDDLLMKLASIRVPDGPLEIILDHFGTDVVAEVTGRSRRVVYKNTPEGKRRVTEPWGKNKGMADADAFMNDKKQILVFSKAGGTGRSYHADNQAKNKRLRRHYLIQAGWQANAAVQGLGRTHRSNQAQSPEWILVTTDLNGQKRFISSIARRLNQLGALTKGQRETGSQGLFSSRDNLESTEASEALIQLITDIFHGEVADLSMADFIRVTGLDRMIDPKTNGLNAQGMPHITQFLNRILNMEIEIQNLVFNEFSRRLDMKVARAIELGTLDTGVETIRAKKTEKINEQIVYTDEKTKAQAKYMEVRLTHDAKLVDFAKSRTMVKNGYVQNIKSGRIWALAGDRSITDINGNVTPGYVAIGANYNYHNIPIEDINNAEKYVRLSDKDAELVWNDEYSTIPKEVTERIHLVTGTILPIWDRLPRENARVYRLQVDGKNIIGRVIPRNDLAETLTALGATQSKVNYKPENVFGNVLHHGYSYKLANRWRIERRKVAGDNRIEIKGADYSSLNELKKYGVFTERIAYEARYFIPTDQDTGINAIKNIIESRPIVEETIPHGAKASDVTTEDVSFGHDTNQLNFGLDPTQTLNVLRGLRDNIKEATPHIEAIGRKMWEDGKRNYDSWFLGMKKFLGDLWRSFKPIMRAVWNKLKDERGSISFEKKDSEPKTAKSEKQSTLQPIREPQDPPVSKDPKVLNLYLKDETDALVQTIMNKLHPKRMTWLETMLKSPEWFGNPQIKNIVRLFMRDRNEIYHETFNDLNMTDDVNAPESTVTEAAKALKNKGLTLAERIAGKVSPEYQRLQEIIDEGDTTWKRDTSKPLDEQIKKFEDHIRQQGATEDTIRVWKLYRQSYDKALDLQTAQLRQMIDELTEEANFRGEKPDLDELNQTLKGALAQMEEWKGFYAPRVREAGNWKVQAYKEHGPMRENREWYREHRGSELAARRLAQKLQREGWTIYNVGEVERIPETIYQDVNAVATAKLIDSALEKLSQKSELSNELTLKFNEEVLREVSNAIKARGFRSTMIHRGRGVVRGFLEDPIQRHLQYTNSLSGGISKARVARMAMKELLGEKIQGQQVGGIDPVNHPKEFQVAQDYIQEQLRNTEPIDRMIGIAKSIATFKFLGFNLRSLAVNTTAVVTTAPAAIHQYALSGKGSITGIMRELAVAGKDYGTVMAGKKLENADEQAFLDEVHRKGWDDAQYTREALGELSKTHSRIWSSMMDGSMYLFGKSEKWNRGTTMLAAYRVARKRGMSHNQAAEVAKEASDKAHGVYGKATMPMWAQGNNPAAKVGQMMYVYGKFSHNYLQMLYDMGLKKHNIKGAMFAFLSPLVLAGGAALPFKDALFGIAGVILGALGEDKDPEKWVWDTIRKHLGPGAEQIGRHGLTGAMGVDISGSLSIGVGVPKNFIDLSGAIGGAANEIIEAGESIRNKQYGKAAEHLLPTGLANPLRAAREAKEGVSTRNNRRVWDEKGRPYVPETGATAARVFGFRSAKQAVLSERTWEGHRQQADFSKKRDSIYEQYRAWLLGGRDREEYKEIVRAVQDYNRKIKGVPGVSPITSKSLRDQVRRMQRPSKREREILQS